MKTALTLFHGIFKLSAASEDFRNYALIMSYDYSLSGVSTTVLQSHIYATGVCNSVKPTPWGKLNS